jgi:hypothetical protein
MSILENGYNGKIDAYHKEDIVGTIKINTITNRLVYLKQFAEGLQLYNVKEMIKNNPDLCKSMFEIASREEVDSNYLLSIVNPNYSEEGSNRRRVEESIVDNFQDFIIALEDEKVIGYSEPLACNERDILADEIYEEDEVCSFKNVDVTPAGVLGWLTGQRHRPVNGDCLHISVNFDHECLVYNPNHTICFPRVGACSKEVQFPVAHMSTPEEFKNVFLLALCKGNAFSKT